MNLKWQDLWNHLTHFVRGWAGWRLSEEPGLEHLPLALYPRFKRRKPRPILAILYSGDGGWGRMESSLANALGRRGIPSAGLDSTRYLWNGLEVEKAVADFLALTRHFQTKWHCEEVIVLGYSMGADMVPPILTQLSQDQAKEIGLRHVVLLSIGDHVEFQFRFSGWLGVETTPEEGIAIAPLVSVLEGMCQVTGFRGKRDPRGEEVIFRDLRLLPGGHFYGGHYRRLAREVIRTLELS